MASIGGISPSQNTPSVSPSAPLPPCTLPDSSKNSVTPAVKGLAAVFGLIGVTVGASTAVLSQGLFLATAALGTIAAAGGGIAGGLIGGVVGGAIGIVPDLLSPDEDSGMIATSGAMGFVAGAAVGAGSAALLASGALVLAIPYFASKTLLEGSNRLLKYAGMPEENLHTFKNFVLILETLSSGEEFVVKKRKVVPQGVDAAKIDFKKRLEAQKLHEGPKALSSGMFIKHWFGTHGIGSYHLVPVTKDENGNVKYVEATVLRQQFGFSKRQAQNLSNKKPDEALTMGEELYATRDKRREALITEMQTILKKPIENFSYAECCTMYDTIHNEGFCPRDVYKEACAGLSQSEVVSHLFQLGFKMKEGNFKISDCKEGLDCAIKNGCLKEFLQGLAQISPKSMKWIQDAVEGLKIADTDKRCAYFANKITFNPLHWNSPFFCASLLDWSEPLKLAARIASCDESKDSGELLRALEIDFKAYCRKHPGWGYINGDLYAVIKSVADAETYSKDRQTVLQQKVDEYSKVLQQVNDDAFQYLYCELDQLEQLSRFSHDENLQIFKEALTKAAKICNPEDPGKVLNDLRALFSKKIRPEIEILRQHEGQGIGVWTRIDDLEWKMKQIPQGA